MSDPDPEPEPDHKRRGVLSLFDRFLSRPAQVAPAAPDAPTAATGELVSQARAFQDLRVEDVMKPRADIVAVPKDCTFAELTARFVEAEHSRMPVYKETLDEPVPSRFTVTSISVSLVLRSMVTMRMKTAFWSRKRGPFNRLTLPSLLRDDTSEADLSGYGDRNPVPKTAVIATPLANP